jgi:Asp-tRNA(Asn)/Glu-tRNA(Gln) amidotransferase A subunit family amidase
MSASEPTAGEWLRRLRSKELSAVELARRQLELLHEVDSRLNAVAAVDDDGVLRDAAEADRRRAAGDDSPLLGLPISIKDSLAVAGLPCLTGSLAREGNVAQEDATVVARSKSAGAVILAKTTVPEYMWSYETESVPHGRTLNAFDPLRTSGGSSGGEAALIAGGGSPLGIGTDGGGSIRVPSHYNGICGLRPSVRLVPETGCWPSSRETGMLDMAAIGPMARSVGDLALLLGIIAGGDGCDPFVGPASVTDYRTVDAGSLRVGFYADDGAWPATAETRAAVAAAAAALAAAGAEVEEVAPPPVADAVDMFFGMMAADGGARARADLAGANGRHVPQMLWLLDNLGTHALSAGEFFELLGRWSAFRALMQGFVARYDVVLSPVAPGPAPLHGCRPGDDQEIENYLPWANAMAHSIAGLPVAVVPVASERGLPLGVHIAGPYFCDHLALAAAAVVEEASGGYARVSWPLL